MADYTVELRSICESYAGRTTHSGYSEIDEVISKALPKIFDFDFPIFDENYRSVLETKIISHFYTREIGMETVPLWKFRLKTKMNEIMPYYNQLYRSETLDFNPLYDVSTTRTYSLTRTGDSTSTRNGSRESSGNSRNIDKYSDTPQGIVDLGKLVSDDNIYVTNVNVNDNEYENATTYNNDETVENRDLLDEYTETVNGKRGRDSYAKMIKDYRNNMLNIDMMVIEELNELFFSLW